MTRVTGGSDPCIVQVHVQGPPHQTNRHGGALRKHVGTRNLTSFPCPKKKNVKICTLKFSGIVASKMPPKKMRIIMVVITEVICTSTLLITIDSIFFFPNFPSYLLSMWHLIFFSIPAISSEAERGFSGMIYEIYHINSLFVLCPAIRWLVQLGEGDFFKKKSWGKKIIYSALEKIIYD